jgi:lactate dehydrogenase-like 2-hydroxyacid dehydrogenase
MGERKPRALVTRKLPEAVEARLGRDYVARLNPSDEIFDLDALVAAAAGQDALLVTASERMSADVIERLPASVRIIATYSVGFEHIDLDAARARAIPVTNTPDVLTDSTAELAMMLILCAARRAHEGDRMVRSDRWPGWAPTMMLGIEVTRKRLGILGMGRIGRALARCARGFDMAVHYTNRTRLAPEWEAGAIFHESPESLLEQSDVLSINCRATPETHHFLDARRIARLPDGAVVVNTARGSIIDDDALIAALRSGKLSAAGLDVFEGEPVIHPGYRSLDNVFLMPHTGSGTIEARNAMGYRALDNLDAFFAGREPPDRVA